jgi:hypothetical protein
MGFEIFINQPKAVRNICDTVQLDYSKLRVFEAYTAARTYRLTPHGLSTECSILESISCHAFILED